MWKLTHLRAKGVENNYGTMGTDILSAVGNNANQPADFTLFYFFRSRKPNATSPDAIMSP